MNFDSDALNPLEISAEKAIELYQNIRSKKNVPEFNEEERIRYLNITFPNTITQLIQMPNIIKSEKIIAISFLISLVFENENKFNDLIVYAAINDLFPKIVNLNDINLYYEKLSQNFSIFKSSVFLFLKHRVDNSKNEQDIFVLDQISKFLENIDNETETENLINSFTILSLLPKDENGLNLIRKEDFLKIIHYIFSLLLISNVDKQLNYAYNLSLFTFDSSYSSEDFISFIDDIQLVQNDQVLKSLSKFYSNIASAIEVSSDIMQKLLDTYKTVFYSQRPILTIIFTDFLKKCDEETILMICEMFDDSLYIPILTNSTIAFSSTNDFISNMILVKIFELFDNISKKPLNEVDNASANKSTINNESILQEISNSLQTIASAAPCLNRILSESILNSINDSSSEYIVELFCNVLQETFYDSDQETADEIFPQFIQHFTKPYQCYIKPFILIISKTSLDFTPEQSQLILSLFMQNQESKDSLLYLLKQTKILNCYPKRKSFVEEIMKLEISKETKEILVQTYELIDKFSDDPLRNEFLDKLLENNGRLELRNGITQLSRKFLNISWGRNKDIASQKIIPFIKRNIDVHFIKDQNGKETISDEEKVKLKSVLIYSFYELLWEKQQVFPLLPESHHKCVDKKIPNFLPFIFQYKDKKYDLKFCPDTVTISLFYDILSILFNLEKSSIKLYDDSSRVFNFFDFPEATEIQYIISNTTYARSVPRMFVLKGNHQEGLYRFEDQIINNGIFDKLINLLQNDSLEHNLLDNIYQLVSLIRYDEKLIQNIKEKPSLLLEFVQDNKYNSLYKTYLLDTASYAVSSDQEIINQINENGILRDSILHLLKNNDSHFQEVLSILVPLLSDSNYTDEIISLLIELMIKSESYFDIYSNIIINHATQFTKTIETNESFLQYLLDVPKQQVENIGKIINNFDNKSVIFNYLIQHKSEDWRNYILLANAYDNSDQAISLAINICENMEDQKTHILLLQGYLAYIKSAFIHNEELAKSQSLIVRPLFLKTNMDIRCLCSYSVMKCITILENASQQAKDVFYENTNKFVKLFQRPKTETYDDDFDVSTYNFDEIDDDDDDDIEDDSAEDENEYNLPIKIHKKKNKPLYRSNTIQIEEFSSRVSPLLNLGNTCYINSVIQQLFYTDQFLSSLFDRKFIGATADEVDADDIITRNLKMLLVLMYRHATNIINPSQFITILNSDPSFPIQIGVQGDSHEFLSLLLEKIRPSSIGCFSGEMLYTTQGLSNDFVKTMNESFISISIPVKNVINFAHALQTAFLPEIFNGQNQLSDEKYGKFDAKRTCIITKCPDILIIQLKRFEYNISTRNRIKLTDPIDIPETIDISPYVLENENEPHKSHTYKLKGIIMHQGIADAGHYTSIVHVENDWINISDSDSIKIPNIHSFLKDIKYNKIGPSPYMLFYESLDIPQPERFDFKYCLAKNERVHIFSQEVININFKIFPAQESLEAILASENLDLILNYFLRVSQYCANADTTKLFSYLESKFNENQEEFMAIHDSIKFELTLFSTVILPKYKESYINTALFYGKLISNLNDENTILQIIRRYLEHATNQAFAAFLYPIITKSNSLCIHIASGSIISTMIQKIGFNLVHVISDVEYILMCLIKVRPCIMENMILTFLTQMHFYLSKPIHLYLMFTLSKTISTPFIETIISSFNLSQFHHLLLLSQTDEDVQFIATHPTLSNHNLKLLYWRSVAYSTRFNKFVYDHFDSYLLTLIKYTTAPYSTDFKYAERFFIKIIPGMTGLVKYPNIETYNGGFPLAFTDIESSFTPSDDSLIQLLNLKSILMDFLKENYNIELCTSKYHGFTMLLRALALYIIRSKDNALEGFDKFFVDTFSSDRYKIIEPIPYSMMEAFMVLSFFNEDEVLKSPYKDQILSLVFEDKPELHYFQTIFLQQYGRFFEKDPSFLLNILKNRVFEKGLLQCIQHSDNQGIEAFSKAISQYYHINNEILKTAFLLLFRYRKEIFINKSGLALFDVFKLISDNRALLTNYNMFANNMIIQFMNNINFILKETQIEKSISIFSNVLNDVTLRMSQDLSNSFIQFIKCISSKQEVIINETSQKIDELVYKNVTLFKDFVKIFFNNKELNTLTIQYVLDNSNDISLPFILLFIEFSGINENKDLIISFYTSISKLLLTEFEKLDFKDEDNRLSNTSLDIIKQIIGQFGNNLSTDTIKIVIDQCSPQLLPILKYIDWEENILSFIKQVLTYLDEQIKINFLSSLSEEKQEKIKNI